MQKFLIPSQVLKPPKNLQSQQQRQQKVKNKNINGKHNTVTKHNAPQIDDAIKKLYQLPVQTSTIDEMVQQHEPYNSIPIDASSFKTTQNPSNIVDNSNTVEVDTLGYVVFGSIEIAMILDLPLAAFQMFKYLVNQARLAISDDIIMNVLEAKQLLLSSMLPNDMCFLAFPLSSTISTSHLHTFIRTTPEQRGINKIIGLSKQMQYHPVSLMKSTDAMSSPLTLLAFRLISMEFANFICSKLLSIFNTNEFPVQVILLNYENTYSLRNKFRISREPVVLLTVPSTSSKLLIDRFYAKLSQMSDIDRDVVTSGKIMHTNIVPGLQLECTSQLSNFSGKKFQTVPQHHIVELMNITMELNNSSITTAIIDIVKPHNLFISVIRSCMSSNNGTYYLIANSNVKSLDLTALQTLGASNGKVVIKFLDDLPPGYATKFATNSFRRNETKVAATHLPDAETTTMSTGDSTFDLPTRLDHILNVLLDVQQRLAVVEDFVFSSTPGPPRKTSNTKAEQSPMLSSSLSQASTRSMCL